MILQKTFSSSDITQLDFECNEFRRKFDVKFSQSSMATVAMGESYIVIYSCQLMYEVK